MTNQRLQATVPKSRNRQRHCKQTQLPKEGTSHPFGKSVPRRCLPSCG